MSRTRLHIGNSICCLVLGILGAVTQLSAQVTVNNTGASGSNGFNATEGTGITGTSGFDMMWADSTQHRWMLNNGAHGVLPVSAWPCTSAGCIPIAGSSQIGTIYTEQQLGFPTGGPGVPLLSGTALPQWGAQPGSTGVYALDLQTGNYGLALATEVPNSSTGTGMSPNLLAKITTGSGGGATTATTSVTDTTVPTYIVVSGNGTTGNAQLAIDGQASCTRDAAVPVNSQGNYLVASTTTAGDCSAQYSTLASIPFGTWIVGQLITTGSISSGSLGQVLVHPGYRSLANGVSTPSTLTSNLPIIGGGSKTVALGSSSGSTTEFATVNSSTTAAHPAAWDSSGNLVDNQSPAMTSPTMTTQSVGDNSTKGATTAYVRQEIQMTWSCHLSSGTGAVQTSCQWTLPAAVTFTQFDVHVVNAGASCSTAPILALYDNTGGATVGSFSVTLSNSTNTFTVVTGSASIVSGHIIVVKTTTAGVSCSPAPSGIDITATYQMTG